MRHRNMCVVGDPDQSIYAWRGADIRNILEFEKDYPDAKVVRLEQNYRSTKRILQIASELIAHNTQRKDKTLWTENPEGRQGQALPLPGRVRRGRRRHEAAARAARRARLRVEQDGRLLPHQRAVARDGRRAAARPACRTRSRAAWSSTTARRSRTCWRTCASSRTPATR